MKLFVKAKPGAKIEKVEKTGDGCFEIWVKEPPIQGKANRAVINALANFLDLAPSSLVIVSGHTSRNKIIEIKN